MRELPTGTVTFLFSDIEGSTRLLQQVGERYASLLEACRSLLRAAFLEFHGYEVDTQGDAFFVAFARATDAIAAAVSIQRALFTHAWPEGVMVRVRIGLHTGEPQRSAEGYVGMDVHHAARIMSAGYGGQVLLSQTTRDLVEQALPKGVSLLDLGAHRLKDLQQPDHLYQLMIADLPADFPPPRTLNSQLNNLPRQPTSFIGREHEVARVIALLRREDVQLVTLTGAGGSGKTRLGLQVAEELSGSFADGIFFVNLAPMRDSEFVVPAIAQVLGVNEIEGKSLFDLLKAFLREKHMLLLLDNFEQVVRAAPQVAELLASSPKLKILVTSRMALHVRAEHAFPVPPLALPDPTHMHDVASLSRCEAVALFLQQAQTIKPDFQLTEANAGGVAEICARLEGLPLAIELAAARIKLYPPRALLARLGKRLHVLTGGARDAPARQQTLRDTIAWSYDLLDSQERRLFRQLSVFAGGCALEAIEAFRTADDERAEQLLDEVASLIDKNLVQQSEQESDEPRLVMLETIREYGLEALAESREMEAVQHAHALYYLALAEEAEPELAGPQQAEWLERLEREHDNLRAALSWALEQESGEVTASRREVGLRLGVALRQFWISHAHLQEGRSFLERAVAASVGATLPLRAKVLIAAADLALEQGDDQWGEPLAEEGLRLCQELEDRAGVGCCLFELGRFATRRRKYALARWLLEESAALFRELSDKNRLGRSLSALGMLKYDQNELVRAHAFFKEALAHFRELGNKEGTAFMLMYAALTLYYSAGDIVTARSLSDEGLMLARGMSNKSILGHSLFVNAEIALGQGDTSTAYSRAKECLALYRELEFKSQTADVLSILGCVEARLGKYAATQSLYQEALTIARERNFRPDFPLYLKELAVVVAAQGERVWAARLLGAAEALSEYLQEVINYPPLAYPVYERTTAALRTQLGEETFVAAWNEGRTMPLESVIGPEGRKVT